MKGFFAAVNFRREHAYSRYVARDWPWAAPGLRAPVPLGGASPAAPAAPRAPRAEASLGCASSPVSLRLVALRQQDLCVFFPLVLSLFHKHAECRRPPGFSRRRELLS